MRSLDRIFRARAFLQQKIKKLSDAVRKLFSNGEQGVWYDPSDLTTLFQDAAGTTPVTAVEQPVGLMLDKSKGLVLGPELVSNGDFSNGTTGWTLGTNSSISGGVATVGAYSGAGGLAQNGILTAGKTYRITLTLVTSGSGADLKFHSTLWSPEVSLSFPALPAGTYSFTIKALSANFAIGNFGGVGVQVDNISVRELPGNHAFQTTSTNRPVLSSRYNILNNTDVLSTQSVTTRAAKHILSFWGTGTVSLSGSYTGSLIGTSSENRVYIEFTATAGTLTLTVTGSVLKAQLEEL